MILKIKNAVDIYFLIAFSFTHWRKALEIQTTFGPASSIDVRQDMRRLNSAEIVTSVF